MTISKIDYTDPKHEDPLEEVYAIMCEISEQYGHDIHQSRIVETDTERKKSMR